MPTFDLKCPNCGAVFQAEEEWIGQTGECADCGGEIVIKKTLSFSSPLLNAINKLPKIGGGPNSKPQPKTGSTAASEAEMRLAVKDHFVDITEDKLTEFRHVKSKSDIRLEEIHDEYSVLDMGMLYVKKNDVGSVFFNFSYSRDCDSQVSDTCFNLKMNLRLDDARNMELTETSGWESDFSQGEKGHLVIEKIQLAVPIPDLKEIANARKIEYVVKTDNREIRGKLADYPGNRLLPIKGFYNNVFDGGFKLEYLYRSISAHG